MKIVIQHIHETRLNADDRELILRWDNRLAMMEELLMAVSAEVQQVLDLAKQNTSVVASVDLGMKALKQQVADLLAQIASGTPSLSQDDKDALTATATEIQGSITTLQADIPANTGAT